MSNAATDVDSGYKYIALSNKDALKSIGLETEMDAYGMGWLRLKLDNLKDFANVILFNDNPNVVKSVYFYFKNVQLMTFSDIAGSNIKIKKDGENKKIYIIIENNVTCYFSYDDTGILASKLRRLVDFDNLKAGYDAYELTKAQGYTGTKDEFYKKLATLLNS